MRENTLDVNTQSFPLKGLAHFIQREASYEPSLLHTKNNLVVADEKESPLV
jgi:hypothetical protein